MLRGSRKIQIIIYKIMTILLVDNRKADLKGVSVKI